MILVRDLRWNIGEKEQKLTALAARALGVDKREISALKIVKKSLDARKSRMFSGAVPSRSP